MAVRDPRRDADQYIKKHRIDALFQELGTRLVYSRAEDPNEFLLGVLEEMKAAKSADKPNPFFTNEDITTLFDMFDPTGRGSISLEQYQQALLSLGIDDPVGTMDQDRIDRKTFATSMFAEIKALST